MSLFHHRPHAPMVPAIITDCNTCYRLGQPKLSIQEDTRRFARGGSENALVYYRGATGSALDRGGKKGTGYLSRHPFLSYSLLKGSLSPFLSHKYLELRPAKQFCYDGLAAVQTAGCAAVAIKLGLLPPQGGHRARSCFCILNNVTHPRLPVTTWSFQCQP